MPDIGVLASKLHNIQLISRKHPAAALHMESIHPGVVITLDSTLNALLHILSLVFTSRLLQQQPYGIRFLPSYFVISFESSSVAEYSLV